MWNDFKTNPPPQHRWVLCYWMDARAMYSSWARVGMLTRNANASTAILAVEGQDSYLCPPPDYWAPLPDEPREVCKYAPSADGAMNYDDIA